MKLVFVTNARFTKNNRNEVYGIHTSLNRESLKSYLTIFEKVYVVGRVELVENIDYSKATRVDDFNIEVLSLPYFTGILGFLNNRVQIKKRLSEYMNIEAAHIFRIPGSYGRISASILNKKNKPFGVEIVADPFDVFAPGTFKHPLRRVLRFSGLYYLKSTTKMAAAAIYVTKEALQKRYPVKENVFSTSASDVVLNEEAFGSGPKKLTLSKSEYTIVSVGSLDQMYKGPDVLIKAVEILIKRYGLQVNLIWMGDGKYKNQMIQFSQDLKIDKRVKFMGVIKPASKLRKILDSGDLFVLASRTEGLPRAIIEAMARGLPCVSTRVGGIPELISYRALVNKNNHRELADKIHEVLKNSDFANKLAKENYEKSKLFKFSMLKSKREEFFEEVKRLTETYYKK